VLRLDWSPDGQYVVSAHAMNNSGPTAQIIERGNQHGWQTKKDFVGHRKAITVVVCIASSFQKSATINYLLKIAFSCYLLFFVSISYSPVPQILSTIDHPPTHRLPTGLQPDCLHGLCTTLHYVLVFCYLLLVYVCVGLN